MSAFQQFNSNAFNHSLVSGGATTATLALSAIDADDKVLACWSDTKWATLLSGIVVTPNLTGAATAATIAVSGMTIGDYVFAAMVQDSDGYIIDDLAAEATVGAGYVSFSKDTSTQKVTLFWADASIIPIGDDLVDELEWGDGYIQTPTTNTTGRDIHVLWYDVSASA